MQDNAFAGHLEPPSADELGRELGPRSKALWDRLQAQLAAAYGLTTGEWTSYSKKAGWSFRLKQGQRNIIYLSPGHGGFMASLALGDRAIAALREGRPSRRLLELLEAAPRYAEGTGVRVDVAGVADLALIKKLVAAKLAS
jgi:hypothetical protein